MRRSLGEFLAGHGRGELSDDLFVAEVVGSRSLILATKANRKDQLAIAAGLADVYRDPTGHQRLTTLSFKDYPYDSLWRGALSHRQWPPLPRASSDRDWLPGEVYELAVPALRRQAPTLKSQLM